MTREHAPSLLDRNAHPGQVRSSAWGGTPRRRDTPLISSDSSGSTSSTTLPTERRFLRGEGEDILDPLRPALLHRLPESVPASKRMLAGARTKFWALSMMSKLSHDTGGKPGLSAGGMIDGTTKDQNETSARTNQPTKTVAIPGGEPSPVRAAGWPEVLTLAEAAAFLRVPEADVVRMVGPRGLPGRLIGSEWRFSRTALDDWLRTPPSPPVENPCWPWPALGRTIPTLTIW